MLHRKLSTGAWVVGTIQGRPETNRIVEQLREGGLELTEEHSLTTSQGRVLAHILAAFFFLVSLSFVYRSFYGMRIRGAS